MSTKSFSTFKKFIHPTGEITIDQLYERIRSDEFAEHIKSIRKLISSGNVEEADFLKKNLPAFTVSCHCEGGRSVSTVKAITGYVILDFDNLSQEELYRLKALLRLSPYVVIYFVSVSGNGLKVIVETNNVNLSNHKETFGRVSLYFESLLDVSVDVSGSDIVRLCFFSHDPQAYYNPNNKIFEVPLPSPKTEDELQNERFEEFFKRAMMKAEILHPYSGDTAKSADDIRNFLFALAGFNNLYGIPYDKAFKMICAYVNEDMGLIMAAVSNAYSQKGIEQFYKEVQDSQKFPETVHLNRSAARNWGSEEEAFYSTVMFTNRVRSYAEGGRNNYVFLLACNCYRTGLSEDSTLSMILRDFNYNEREVETTVRSAFRNCRSAA